MDWYTLACRSSQWYTRVHNNCTKYICNLEFMSQNTDLFANSPFGYRTCALRCHLSSQGASSCCCLVSVWEPISTEFPPPTMRHVPNINHSVDGTLVTFCSGASCVDQTLVIKLTTRPSQLTKLSLHIFTVYVIDSVAIYLYVHYNWRACNH